MGQLYANIIVDISQEKLDRTFSYLVPETMQNLIHIGDVVEVPFGKGNRLTKGYVVELTGTTQYQISKMKPVQEILVEEESKEKGIFTGRTQYNLLVHFPGTPDLLGKYVNVRLDTCKGFYYMGTRVED